jgi:flagellar basal-body rod modification protein FlgD
MEVNPYQNLPGLRSIQDAETTDSKSLGQDEFLKLMTTQLSHQDPFEPMDNGEFLGQIAQFGTVNGINDLLASFQDLSTNLQSSQALQASGLIGRQVLVNSDEGYLAANGNISGAVDLDSSAQNVAVNIYDAFDSLVGRVDLGEQLKGVVPFNWDGTTLAGQTAPPGHYRIEVEATRGGQTEAQSPLINAHVISLTLGGVGREMQVELENLGQVNFSDVNQIL